MNSAYSFLRDRDTYVVHISKGNFTIISECTSRMHSLCRTASTDESDWLEPYFCLTEQQAREVVAKFGKEACSNCVSHLYGESIGVL